MKINSLLEKLKHFTDDEDDFELVHWEFFEDEELKDCLGVKLFIGEKEKDE